MYKYKNISVNHGQNLFAFKEDCLKAMIRRIKTNKTNCQQCYNLLMVIYDNLFWCKLFVSALTTRMTIRHHIKMDQV